MRTSGERWHSLRIVFEDGGHVAVHEAHQACAIALLDGRGIPRRFLRGDPDRCQAQQPRPSAAVTSG
jgi:hypothetical protein